MTPEADHNAAYRLRAACNGRPHTRDGFRLDLVDALNALVLGLARKTPSAPSLNVGGWRSSDGFLDRTDAVVADLANEIRSIVSAQGRGTLRTYGWAIVNRRGSRHRRHHHSGGILSGIYVVTPGDPITPTVFFVGNDQVSVETVAGRLILFPSDLEHEVPVYAGDTPRITIAFDVRPR